MVKILKDRYFLGVLKAFSTRVTYVYIYAVN